MTSGRALCVPPTLSTRSRVGIISPSGPVLATHLEAGIQMMREWKLEPVVRAQTYARHPRRGYLAGEDDLRLEALQAALDDPTLDAIIFARGGYGAMRLLERLDPQGLIAHPKMLVGFSDITALLLWCMHQAHTICLHAPVIKSLAHTQYNEYRARSAQMLHDALTISAFMHTYPVAIHPPVKPVVTGRVIAGNLSLIQALLGTPYLPTLEGCVLFVEDITEQDYRLDRLFTSLRLRAGEEKPAAIVLGEFLECGGVYVGHDEIEDYVTELAMEFGVPVFSEFPSGHGAVNHPIPVGAWVTIDAPKGTLTFHAEERAL